MSSSEANFWAYFFELYESIPRQGPGLDSATREALNHVVFPPTGGRLLDIGCGAGVQTLELARRSSLAITATDLHAPFLDILRRKAEAEGLGDRITTLVADMAELPFPDRSFDVLWAEGCIFIIGFAEGLSRWKRLLAPGGYLVISEFTWFRENPPAELAEFVQGGSSEDLSLAARRKAIAEAGYELVHEFPLPSEAWRDIYYAPLMERLPDFEKRHADDPDARAVVARGRHEIDLYRRYGDYFGYTFFILKC